MVNNYKFERTKNFLVPNFVYITMFAVYLNELSVIDDSINKLFNIGSLVFGFFVALLILYESQFKDKNYFYLLFVFALLLSALLNYKSYGMEPLKKVIFFINNILFFYYAVKYLSDDKTKLKKFILSIIVMHFVFSFISIIMWIKPTSILLFINDRVRSVGIRMVTSKDTISYLLFYGLFRDSNYLASIAIISIFLSLFIYRKFINKNFCKVFLIINIALQYSMLLLTNSRANIALFSVLVPLSLLPWRLSYALKPKKQIIINLAISITSVVLLFNGSQLLKKTMINSISLDKISFVSMNLNSAPVKEINHRDTIKIRNFIISGNENINKPNLATNMEHYFSKISNPEQEEFNLRLAGLWEGYLDQDKMDDIELNDKVDLGGTGNGRIKIWLEALTLSKSKPLFGYGTFNLNDKATDVIGESSWIGNGYVIDNAYLEAIVTFGGINFLLAMLLTLTRAIKGLKNMDLWLILVFIFISSISLFYAGYLIGNIFIAHILTLVLAVMNREQKEV